MILVIKLSELCGYFFIFKSMSHILVVGGTGMLKEVPLYFTRHGFTVSVIARNQVRFNKLMESRGEHGFINPVKVDYSDYNLLEEKINSAIDNYGKIETCISWIPRVLCKEWWIRWRATDPSAAENELCLVNINKT